MSDETRQEFLQWRGVRDPCPRCRGSGVVVYGSTATWRGGMGGASMTRGLCDACWGSGDAGRAWDDLRAWRDGEDARVAARAGELLARSVGANLWSCAAAVTEIADELERLSRGRKARAGLFHDLAASLAKTLRATVAATAERDALIRERAARDGAAAGRESARGEGRGRSE